MQGGRKNSVGVERVRIEKLVAGGIGLARAASGKILLVPMVLPGEEVAVRPLRSRKGYLEAELQEVVTGHPGRVSPRCPHYGRCGGCDLQHAAYPLQLELKGDILLDQLHRAGVGVGEPGRLGEPLPAVEDFGYRQRLRLQLDKAGRWGFFRCRSHELEVIAECPLAVPEVNAVIRQFPVSPALGHLLGQGLEIEVSSSPGTGMVFLLVKLRRKARAADLLAARRVAVELSTVAAVFVEVDGQQRLGPFPECPGLEDGRNMGLIRLPFPALPKLGLPAYTLSQEVGGFCQVNQSQNRRMIEQMLAWLNLAEVRRVADLYCGMGNFSIPLALAGISVTGSDLQRSAIRSAVFNAKEAGVSHCRFIQAPAEQTLRDLASAGERFDLLVLDPPRRGCAELVGLLGRLGAGLLLYVSCDPATLTRDLVALIGHGYGIEKIGIIDMFPQTAHLETMVLLRR